MRAVQKRSLLFPGLLASARPLEPVGAGMRKGLRLPGESLPNPVLPVRGVDDELADVVASRGGPPPGLSGRDTAQGSLQRRAVPRGRIVAFIERVKQDPRRRRSGLLHEASDLASPSQLCFGGAADRAGFDRDVMMSATDPTMTNAAIATRAVITSPAKRVPRTTATIGFTYA